MADWIFAFTTPDGELFVTNGTLEQITDVIADYRLEIDECEIMHGTIVKKQDFVRRIGVDGTVDVVDDHKKHDRIRRRLLPSLYEEQEEKKDEEGRDDEDGSRGRCAQDAGGRGEPAPEDDQGGPTEGPPGPDQEPPPDPGGGDGGGDGDGV